MFNVIKDFSENLSTLSSTSKFLFYKERYGSKDSADCLSVSEIKELLKSAVDNHKLVESKMQAAKEELLTKKTEAAVEYINLRSSKLSTS